MDVPDFPNLAGPESDPIKDIQKAGFARYKCIQLIISLLKLTNYSLE